MINLLPPEEKKELVLKKRYRLLIILGGVFMAGLICLVLVLFSVKLYISGENITQKEKLDEITRDYKSVNLSQTEKEINKYNKELADLESFYINRAYFNEMLKSILKVDLPKGVYLIDVSIDRKSSIGLEATLYGFSDTRDNLLTFRKNIEKEKSLKNPTFSQESWTKSDNVNFYLTFDY